MSLPGNGWKLTMRRSWVFLTAMLALQVAAATQTTTVIWKLDPGRSKFDRATPLKSETRTYETTGRDIKMTVLIETVDDRRYAETATYREDGKPYRLYGDADFDAIRVRRIDPWETRTTYLRSGKVVGGHVSVMAKDGRSRTMTRTWTSASGQSRHSFMVFERQ